MVRLLSDRTIEFTAEAETWLSLDISPDGKTILFDLLGDLYTVPIEGGDARAIATGLAFEGQARFSPDGKRIAYLSDRDGSDPRQLTREKQAQCTSPSWTPDGDYVQVSKNVGMSHAVGAIATGDGAHFDYTHRQKRFSPLQQLRISALPGRPTRSADRDQ